MLLLATFLPDWPQRGESQLGTYDMFVTYLEIVQNEIDPARNATLQLFSVLKL